MSCTAQLGSMVIAMAVVMNAPQMMSSAAAIGSQRTMIDPGPSPKPVSLGRPASLAIGPDDTLYIADTKNHRVVKVAYDGQLYVIAGTGKKGFGGDGGQATLAALNGPSAVAFDTKGNLYISDAGNRRIRRVATDGNITTIAGSGKEGSGGDGGPAAAAALTPGDIVADHLGNVYVLVRERILRISPDGMISTFAGRTPKSNEKPECVSTLEFRIITGLAVDASGNVYASALCSRKVYRITPEGVVSTLLGKETLFNPLGIAVDPHGNVYVADQNNHVIRRISPSGLVTVAVGDAGYDVRSASGGFRPTVVATATALVVDRKGNIYFAFDPYTWRPPSGGVVGAAVESIASGEVYAKFDGEDVVYRHVSMERVWRKSPDGSVIRIVGK